MNKHLDTFRAAFTGTVPLSSLKPLAHDFAPMGDTHMLFACPCGGKDHAATAAMNYDAGGLGLSMSPVLHCWITGQQWFITHDADIIATEESRFIALLEKHKDILGRRVTATEAFRLCTERGVPADMLDIDDMDGFDALMDRHKKISRAN